LKTAVRATGSVQLEFAVDESKSDKPSMSNAHQVERSIEMAAKSLLRINSLRATFTTKHSSLESANKLV
jgi:hypothetical protein